MAERKEDPGTARRRSQPELTKVSSSNKNMSAFEDGTETILIKNTEKQSDGSMANPVMRTSAEVTPSNFVISPKVEQATVTAYGVQEGPPQLHPQMMSSENPSGSVA